MADLLRNQGMYLRDKGEFKTFISYFDDEDGSKEPILCVVNRKSRIDAKKLCGIALSAAHKYVSETYLIQQAQIFARMLGHDSWYATRQIADAIMDGLDDLVMAAEYELVEDQRHPEPKKAKGEVEIRVNGDTVAEAVVH